MPNGRITLVPGPETDAEKSARWRLVAAGFRRRAAAFLARDDSESAYFSELNARSAEQFARLYEQPPASSQAEMMMGAADA